MLPVFADVVAASGRLEGRVIHTPVMSSERFDARVGRKVLLKCENLQHIGAFKFRGALNTLLQLEAAAAADPSSSRIVATHSSGNHGAALARAARELGWRCLVVTPNDASPVKLANITAEGATLRHCEPGLAPREAALAEIVAQTGAAVVHPFDDARVIAGQGTAALELLSTHPNIDVISTPVGGGGLLSGTALAARGLVPTCRVIGVEPKEADDAARSFHTGIRVGMSGSPPTMADGLRGSLGVLPFEIFKRQVNDILTVEEAAIVQAMRIALEDFRLLIEPSSAVVLAAILDGRLGKPGETLGVIVSGGNVDLSVCPFLSGQRSARTS